MSGFFRQDRSISRPQSASSHVGDPDRPMTATARRAYLQTPDERRRTVRDEDVRRVARTEEEYDHPNGPKNLIQGTDVFNIKTDVDRQRSLKLGPADPVPHTVTRRHVRQVEVPYVKEVKVPVKIPKVVPGRKSYRQVKVKRLVEVPSHEYVDELYTEVEEVPAVRHKTIWVEKIVPERYMKQVEVQKTRKVKVPTTTLQEVEDFETVSVIDDAATEVDGFRIDTVGGKKLVEVEEEQEYEAFYRPKGLPRAVDEHELGVVTGVRTSRHVGRDIFEGEDRTIQEVDMDSEDGRNRSRVVYSRPGTAQSVRRPQSAGAMSRYSTGHAHRSSWEAHERSSTSQHGFRLGVTLLPVESGGVVVDQVFRGEPAERAGLHIGDIITGVSGYKVGDLKEFRNALYMAPGPVELEVRNGHGRRRVTVHR